MEGGNGGDLDDGGREDEEKEIYIMKPKGETRRRGWRRQRYRQVRTES